MKTIIMNFKPEDQEWKEIILEAFASHEHNIDASKYGEFGLKANFKGEETSIIEEYNIDMNGHENEIGDVDIVSYVALKCVYDDDSNLIKNVPDFIKSCFKKVIN